MIRTTIAVLAAVLCAAPALAAPQCRSGEIPNPACSPGVIASTDQADVCGYVDGLSYSKRAPAHAAGAEAVHIQAL